MTFACLNRIAREVMKELTHNWFMGLRSEATYLKRTYTPDNSKKNYMHFLYFGLVNAYPMFEDKTIKLVVENPEKLLHHNLL